MESGEGQDASLTRIPRIRRPQNKYFVRQDTITPDEVFRMHLDQTVKAPIRLFLYEQPDPDLDCLHSYLH